MKYTFKSNLGSVDAKKVGLDHTKCQRGDTVDLTKEQAEALLAKYKAIIEPADAVRGVAPAPAVRGVPEESPVSDTNASEAIDAIGRMTSKDKLQHVIDNDPRVTVKEAAKKRVASL